MGETLIIAVIVALVTGAVTGSVSTYATVKALGVHITYLRERDAEHAEEIKALHARIASHIEHYHHGGGRDL